MQVFEGNHYIVDIAHSDEYNRAVYQIVHKEHGVIEYEHPILGQIREVFHVLDKNETDIENGDTVVDVREVVPASSGTTSH